MSIFSDIKEAQRNATGAVGEFFGTLVSLPHATIAGLVNSVQGKSFNEASQDVMQWYAKQGKKIGREQSDEIVRALVEIHRKNPSHS